MNFKTKICSKCGVHPRAYRTSSYCKRCAKDSTMKSIKKRLENFREFMDLAKSHPCVDCKIKYPPYVMDFDHLPQFKKVHCVSQMAFHPASSLREEMLKCELVCANCHRVRTHKRKEEKKKNKLNK